MTEQTTGPDADYPHILADLHALARQHAGQDAALERLETMLAELRAQVAELLPAARRAAAMLDTPVTAFLQARREANGDGGDQRAGTRTSRGRRARATRRQLPDA